MNRRKWRPRVGEVVRLRNVTASPYVVDEIGPSGMLRISSWPGSGPSGVVVMRDRLDVHGDEVRMIHHNRRFNPNRAPCACRPCERAFARAD